MIPVKCFAFVRKQPSYIRIVGNKCCVFPFRLATSLGYQVNVWGAGVPVAWVGACAVEIGGAKERDDGERVVCMVGCVRCGGMRCFEQVALRFVINNIYFWVVSAGLSKWTKQLSWNSTGSQPPKEGSAIVLEKRLEPA